MTIVSAHPDFVAAVSTLRARVDGEVLLPGDAGYDEARLGWNLAHRSAPAVMMVAGTESDVTDAVRVAAALGLPVAVQATGHGPGPAADGAMMIVTSRLTGVQVDPGRRVARVRAGTKWGPVLAAAQEHGLAPLLGSTTDVGVVGYTLGGGMGWLARRHGLASDSLVGVELVTPDGTEIRADEQENPEVFWALRGGGAGTLGVVTSVDIGLVPVRTVYAGNLFYPIEDAREVHRFFAGWTDGIDEEMTSAVTLMNFPPLPEVPEPFRGRSFVLVRGAYCGADPERGRELVDRWRRWRTPEIDVFGPMPFTQCDMISMDPVDPVPALVATESFDSFPEAAVDVAVRAAVPRPDTPPAVLFAELRHAGGAVRRGAAASANDRGRSAEFVFYVGTVPGMPWTAEELTTMLAGIRADLAPYATGAPYLNFLDGDDRRTRAAAAFSPDHLTRLRRVKDVLDPAGRFAFGFGVPTSAAVTPG